MSRSRTALYGNLLLVFGSVLVTLVVAEVALRLLGVSYPYWSRVDPLTGFSPRPGISGIVHDEGAAFVSINSAGFRDREHTVEKPSDTIRVAVLGDSYTEGKQVEMDETFWSVAERELAACPARGKARVEFLNFGVSGYGTAQEWLLLERIWPYQPDVVVVAFTAGNDVINNSREIEGGDNKPYVEDVDGVLTPDFSFRAKPFFQKQTSLTSWIALAVIDHSRVAQLVAQVLRVARRKQAVQTAATAETASGAVLREFGLDRDIYTAPKTAAYARAWRLTELLLQGIAAQARTHKSGIVVMTVPISIQTHPDPAVRDAARRKLKVPNLFYAENRVIAAGKRGNYPVLALGRPMQRDAQAQKTFFNGAPGMAPGSGHWNAKGHGEAGRLLSQFLCSKGIIH